MKKSSQVQKFDSKKSVKRAQAYRQSAQAGMLQVADHEIVWNSKMDLIQLSRKGLPIESIQVLADRANLTIARVLGFMGVAQTTYNKKKRGNEALGAQESEVVLQLIELLDFGIEVFNHEEDKFHRWLKKPSIALGGVSPESLFDTVTGILEVKKALGRLETGNLA